MAKNSKKIIALTAAAGAVGAVAATLAACFTKFDHKYADEPWKNAKDSLTRAMIKTASVLPEEEKKKK